MRSELDFQANQIEYVLACHRLSGRVEGGVVTPRTVSFRLIPSPGVKLRRFFDLSEELALTLGVSQCRILRQKNCLAVEVPRAQRVVVALPQLCDRLPRLSNCTAVLGVEHDGRPLLLHLPSPDVAHVLIAGSTGSGKTELARAMIASLIRLNRPAQVQLVLIDPKRRGFAPFAGARHLLRPIITEPDEAVAALADLTAEMLRRDEEGRSTPRVVVFIDELADLALSGPKEAQTFLTRLTQRGRQAGIHVVACTQKPTAEVIGSLVKANFPVRLVGAVSSPEDAKVASGLARSGAERLLGRGDFLAVARGEMLRFQAAFISELEIAGWLRGDASIGLEAATAVGQDRRLTLPQRLFRSIQRVK